MISLPKPPYIPAGLRIVLSLSLFDFGLFGKSASQTSITAKRIDIKWLIPRYRQCLRMCIAPGNLPVDAIANVRSLWGEEYYADATIKMGQKTWHVHRVVVCKQSKYFEKAFEGGFKASEPELATSAADRSSEFLEEDVDAMLKYLYFHKLEMHQQKDPITTFVVADYFQVTSLRAKAINELTMGLGQLAKKKYFANFKKWSHLILEQHADTQLERTMIKVIAENLQMVMHESGAWDELTDAYPLLCKKVLAEMIPKPTEADTVKRPAGVAFDDTYHLRSGSNKRGFRPGSTFY
ncbi:hypothetical protein J7T55_015314 [Diaporthe amygdali]|uniref:uncharacterized protein n=1 Tax=Phomopsis amygdali TaxID=1214568 RepID=UPI0022FE8D50|nr:uncharacterized protein J7T55_015314 [Diaporthe amygdali]KAJ0120585.1 hypothetical protein J7T55_015314 [Diaporthe amygdali]